MNKTETRTLRGKVRKATEFYMERKAERIWGSRSLGGSLRDSCSGGSGEEAVL